MIGETGINGTWNIGWAESACSLLYNYPEWEWRARIEGEE